MMVIMLNNFVCVYYYFCRHLVKEGGAVLNRERAKQRCIRHKITMRDCSPITAFLNHNRDNFIPMGVVMSSAGDNAFRFARYLFNFLGK